MRGYPVLIVQQDIPSEADVLAAHRSRSDNLDSLLLLMEGRAFEFCSAPLISRQRKPHFTIDLYIGHSEYEPETLPQMRRKRIRD